VEPKQRVYVHRLEAKEGDSVELKNILLLDNNGKVTVGTPLVEGATVAAKVLSHLKGDKVIIFKKRRRKGYRKLNGHRQYFTQIFIQGIAANGEKMKLEEAPIVKAKGREEVDEVVVETKPKKAKAAPKAAAKKTPAKKVTKKKEA
ncbi:MAG: 50S ribosomal protein L21, partial [Bacteroidia bacterium]|nr:50S ribosomal protein L21 [Bacteroidia bacterium]